MDSFRYVIALVAALSVPELFMQDAAVVLEQAEAAVDEDDESSAPVPSPKPMQQWKLEGIAKGGDFGMLLAAVGACDYVASKGGSLDSFCTSKCIRSKAMFEVRKLRSQLERHEREELTLRDDDFTADVGGDKKFVLEPLAPPTSAQEDAVRQIILSGFGDHVARLSSQVEPELAKHGIFGYACDAVDELVYIHPSSSLHRRKPESVVCVAEIYQSHLRLSLTTAFLQGLLPFENCSEARLDYTCED